MGQSGIVTIALSCSHFDSRQEYCIFPPAPIGCPVFFPSRVRKFVINPQGTSIPTLSRDNLCEYWDGDDVIGKCKYEVGINLPLDLSSADFEDIMAQARYYAKRLDEGEGDEEET